MELPRTNHPHLTSLGLGLARSLRRHLVDNDAVRSAFAELSFELELAQQMGAPAPVSGLLESTV